MTSQAATAGRRYDLVVFGATGFTGQYVVEEVARIAGLEAEKKREGVTPLTWAVAGRSKNKLQASLTTAKEELGMAISS